MYSNTPSGLHQTTRVARPRVGGEEVAQVDDAADVLSTYNKESGGGWRREAEGGGEGEGGEAQAEGGGEGKGGARRGVYSAIPTIE